MPIHGFVNIDKPAGLTSHDVVARLRRLAGQRRVGHGGTLDPAATGVLPIGLGEATRLLPYLVEGRKRYLATIELGRTTTTDDAEGTIVAEGPVPPLTIDQLEQALAAITGTIQQVPPMYSAIQVGGQRMYDLARQGQTITLAARPVEIEQIAIVDWRSPLLQLDIRCGKGTYIRAIARDLGAALGCGAHLRTLRRSAVGPLTLREAVPLAELLDDPARLQTALLLPDVAVADWPRVDLHEADAQRVRHGLPLDLPPQAAEQIRAHAPDTRLLALLRADAGVWRPFRVFGWS